ncbi:zinc chelation protein SecC [Metabacillus malikii]|uniref:HEAT repeat domain-containing protein n=1 Tax=Metabacillus malikii TaxID=1504265 RepID=A0ABT9ZF22_9BACI|nr:zinc chelation protein SecC [Metabacillus malikii]MDQ0230834.1 hypothetical protein [Metabacillus malikii]
MNFFERIEANLLTDDPVVQEFVLESLHDYPNVDKKWVERLLKEAVINDIKRDLILIYCPVDSEHEEVIPLVMDGLQNTPNESKHLYVNIIDKLSPAILWKYKELLAPFYTEEEWSLYDVLVNGEERKVFAVFNELIERLNNEQAFNGNLYRMAKKTAYILVKKQWITDNELESIFISNLQNEWFQYDGYLAIYMIGLMKNERYIQQLTQLLVRDDDILLDEVAFALIFMQKEAVVDAVAPFLIKEESCIFATSIVENYKTDYANKVLKNAYYSADGEDSRAMIIEALAHQLNGPASQELNEYVSERPETFLFSVADLAYSYYKIIDESHPLMNEWINIINQERNGAS